MKKLAVLLTCHNRKDKTLNCLTSLYASIEKADPGLKVSVYLVDDGSTDGTSAAIANNFPQINIIPGNGQLFWAGGMRLAWKSALTDNADYYLLLNDDTFLFADSMNRIISESTTYLTENSVDAIFVGSTIDRDSGKLTYGGRKLYSSKSPKSFLVHDETILMECDLGNANIMLVPDSIVRKIGILSEKYTHSIADHDYTLLAKEQGFKVFVMPGIMGTCKNDGNKGKIPRGNLSKRINYLYSHKGISYKEYLHFIRSHFPRHLPKAFLKLWLKTLFPVIYDQFRK